MSTPRRHQALVDAAGKLDEALTAYEKAAHGFLKLRLDSQKNLARASEALGEITRIDEELSVQVSALVSAIAAVRDEQQGRAEAVQKQALEVLERRQALQGLVERLGGLGEQVLAARERLMGGEGGEPAGATGPAEDLRRATELLGELAEQIKIFAEDAKGEGFADLAEEAYALRQQLLAVKSRADRFDKSIPQA
jgi:hypothetical protein